MSSSFAHLNGRRSPPPQATRVLSVQDVPDDLTDEDDLYQPVTPTPASRQLPLHSRSSLYGTRVSLAPESSTRRTTWMGDRESRYVPDLPTTGGQRRASSGHGLEVPLGASSARSSRTLTPSDVPFAAGPNHSTPAKARALNGSAHELHISMPDPDGYANRHGGDSRASTASSLSKRTTSTGSSFGNDRLAPTHPYRPLSQPNGKPADPSRPESDSWISLSQTRTPSLAQSSQQSLLSKPSQSSFPRAANESPSEPQSVASSSGRPSLQRDDPAPPPPARTPAAPPLLKLDFGADTSSFFDETDFFSDLGGGLAGTLGSGLGLGAPSSSLASSQRTVGPSYVSANTSFGLDSPSSALSPPDATGVLSGLSEFPRVAAQDASTTAVDRQSSSDLLSRSRTPSVPVSPSADSSFSRQQQASSAASSRLRSFDLDLGDASTAMTLSPELQQQRMSETQQQRSRLSSDASTGASSSLAYRTHQRRQSGSGSGASVSSEGRGPTHRRIDSLASSDRAQSPLSSPPQPTPTSPGPTSSLLDFMKPSSLKRRRSNASMLNILTNASEAPPQFERAKTDSPQARKATPAYGSINKSLPPTPGKLAAAEANNPPPALPFSTNSIGINSGSLRKSAVIALKKSKGLLRTKGSKPADPSAPVPSSSYPYPADDRASIASSIEIPIQMPVGRQPESPYATNVSFPRGPGSASRSSSSIMPRASSESKRSASHPLESSFAIQPKARKSLELLRPGSDASSSSKAAATALAGPRPPQVQPPSATRDTSTREVKPPEPRSLPRQPSTDQLLMLATAKLQALVNAAQAAQSSNGSSRESFPTDAAAPSSDDASSVSSPGPAEETASVGKAVRVQRGSESPQSPKVMLVPSRSLKGSTVPPAEPIRPPPPSQQPTRNVTGPLVLPALATMPVTKEEPVAAAVQEEEGPMFEGPQWVARKIKFERKGSTSDVLAHPWDLLEAGLGDYQDALEQSLADRTIKVTNDLLPFLRAVEAEEEAIPAAGPLARRQRDILFGWLETLVDELKDMPSNRGICLEGVAAIVESRFMSVEALAPDRDDARRFSNALVAVLAFAIDRLNEKAVYANTLAFSGRMLAIAFFRLEGIGLKLLRLLPQVKRLELRRIVEEAGLNVNKMPEPVMDIFPPHLDDLCFRDLNSYCRLLSPMAPSEQAILIASDLHQITMNGNWLIRWCASDSDLPFAFYRAYHRQLASYLHLPSLPDHANPETFLPIGEALTAPGYLFIAASLLEKAESLIHRNMRSVTTLGPNSGTFNTLDSANLSTGAKPKVLEMANRRVVSTMLDIVGGASRPRGADDEVEGLARRRYFGGILQIWLRAVVKRTSLFDARGIFLLLDYLESLIFGLCSPSPPAGQEKESWKPSVEALILFDVPFVLSTVQTIMMKADNTVALMRTVAFLYSLFDIFTLRIPDREQLCDSMLLQPELFQRLFLYWNTSVRGYFQRLVVWRLSRLGQTSDGRPPSTKDPWIFQVLQTLNLRLDAIRVRHNELDPLDDLPDDDLFDERRASVSSTRGVTDQPWAVEELKFAPGRPGHDSRRPSMSTESAVDEDERAVATWQSYGNVEEEGTGPAGGAKGAAKVVNWLKITLNTAGRKAAANKATHRAVGPPNGTRIDPFALDITMPSETVDPTKSAHGQGDDQQEPMRYPEAPVASASSLNSRPGPPIDLVDDDTTEDGLYTDQMPSSPSFFKFEFETDAPQSDAFDARKSTHSEARKSAHGSIKASKRASGHAGDDSDTVYPGGVMSPLRKSGSIQASPRVSKRFSKRTSILPLPAFDLLFETSEPVPAIPAHFRSQPPYELRLHPYAVRGLREYEESLDELEIWLLRVKDDDEELADRDMADLVPRLGVAWPISFDE